MTIQNGDPVKLSIDALDFPQFGSLPLGAVGYVVDISGTILRVVFPGFSSDTAMDHLGETRRPDGHWLVRDIEVKELSALEQLAAVAP